MGFFSSRRAEDDVYQVTVGLGGKGGGGNDKSVVQVIRSRFVSMFSLLVCRVVTHARNTPFTADPSSFIYVSFSVVHFGHGFSTVRRAKNEKINSQLLHFWVACRQRRPYLITLLWPSQRQTGVITTIIIQHLPLPSRKLRMTLPNH